MDDDHQDTDFTAAAPFPPPSQVSLSFFSPQVPLPPRRLSSHFTPPSRPVPATRQLAWVSLQGRLVGAEESSSAMAIGGGLDPQEAVSWDLFNPSHRILIVAIVAAAAADSKKNKQIYQLTKSVQLRDQVLLSMQQNLDNLCEQVNYFKDQPEIVDMPIMKSVEFPYSESSFEKIKFGGCARQLYDQHRPPSNDLRGSQVVKGSSRDETFDNKMSFINEAEPEERRVSDLSDWAPSISSSIDFQLNNSDVEQDIYKLRRECEEKDITIKELSTFLHSAKGAGTKRISELEDVIRRKNTTITKLRKDMMVLEQKVMQLMRLKRNSCSTSSASQKKLPVMADNLVYDMDSITSPSSSDSDCPSRNQTQIFITESQKLSESASSKEQKQRPTKQSAFLVKSIDRYQKSQAVCPLKEKSMNQKSESVSYSRTKQSLSGGRDFTTRRRALPRPKDATPHKRWA